MRNGTHDWPDITVPATWYHSDETTQPEKGNKSSLHCALLGVTMEQHYDELYKGSQGAFESQTPLVTTN